MGSVTLTDLADSDDAEGLAQLLALHRVWFPGHGHVQAELVENARQPKRRGDLVVHQVVAHVDGEPAGFIVVHTNLRRRVGLIHFLAVEEEFRSTHQDGLRLSHLLIESAVTMVLSDGITHGEPTMLGVAAESEPGLLGVWALCGFRPLPTEYSEPYFGMHWADHGEPTFFDMTLVGRPAPGSVDDPRALGRAAAQAFLLDHYRLPPDHPVVVHALQP